MSCLNNSLTNNKIYNIKDNKVLIVFITNIVINIIVPFLPIITRTISISFNKFLCKKSVYVYLAYFQHVYYIIHIYTLIKCFYETFHIFHLVSISVMLRNKTLKKYYIIKMFNITYFKIPFRAQH